MRKRRSKRRVESREKENGSAENKHADGVHGEDRTQIRVHFLSFTARIHQADEPEAAMHCGELCGLFLPGEH